VQTRESEHIDHFLAAIAVFSYFVLAIGLLPPSEHARGVGSGLAVFLTVFLTAWKFGRRIQSGYSVAAVALVASAVLWMPTFPAMGGTSHRAVLIGFLGVQAAVLLWAAFWWQGPREQPSHVSLRAALRFGFLMAAGISGVAAVPVVLLLLTGGESSWGIVLVFPAYFVGFLSAAIIYWGLQRIENLAVGRYLIGVLGGACVYGAVGPVSDLLDHRPFDVHETLLVALIAGSFLGPTLALAWYDEPKARFAKRRRRKVDDLAG
jgi:hypothetical protein